MTLHARPTISADLAALCDLLNHIIAQGGTTAHEEAFDLAAFRTEYYEDPDVAHTVLNNDTPIGFQVLFAVKDGSAIASFTDQRAPVRGAGAVLFAATRQAAITAGFRWIDAKIRADNVPGLAYYTKMGFVDYKIDVGVPLDDGTPVDRITKRLIL